MSDHPASTPLDNDRRWIILGITAIAVLAVLLVGGVFLMATFRPSGPPQSAQTAPTSSPTSPRPTRTPASSGAAGAPGDTPTPTATITETPIGTFTPLPTYTSPPSTSTPRPTWTPAPIVGTLTYTPSPGPSLTPTTDQGGCNYDSSLVQDVTYPSGSAIEIKTPFTKTWQIQNTGCQGWPQDDTKLTFVSGNQLSGPDTVDMDHVKPGQKTNVSVDLVAPSSTGTYVSRWQLAAPDGTLFGQVFIVNIQVIPTQVTFTITYAGPWQCASKPNRFYYSFQITNTTTLTLQSASWKLSSMKMTNTQSDDKPFQSVVSSTNCNDSALNGDSLAPGASAWVSGYFDGKQATSGKTAYMTLSLCTKDGGAGTCSTNTLSFFP